jgi:glutamate-1-semialdehyde aminotransferase
LALGGAQAHFGAMPDLACFGKAMANGFPLAAIVGRGEVMRLFEQVFFSFTFGGEAVSLAACCATIKELRRRQGIEHLWQIGGRLQEGTNALLEKLKLNDLAYCVGLPPFTALRFQGKSELESQLLRSLFQQEALRRGLLTLGNHMLSVAHDEQIVEQTVTAYAEVFEIIAEAMRDGEVSERLEGLPLQPVLRQA